MMKFPRRISAIFLISACVPMHAYVTIQGNDVDEDGKGYRNCTFSLLNPETLNPWREYAIASNFIVGSTASESSELVRMKIKCDGSDDTHLSEMVEIGDPKYLKIPLDIGGVILRRKKN